MKQVKSRWGGINHHSSLTPSSALVCSLVDNFNVGLSADRQKRTVHTPMVLTGRVSTALIISTSVCRGFVFFFFFFFFVMLTRPSPVANTPLLNINLTYPQSPRDENSVSMNLIALSGGRLGRACSKSDEFGATWLIKPCVSKPQPGGLVRCRRHAGHLSQTQSGTSAGRTPANPRIGQPPPYQER